MGKGTETHAPTGPAAAVTKAVSPGFASANSCQAWWAVAPARKGQVVSIRRSGDTANRYGNATLGATAVL